MTVKVLRQDPSQGSPEMLQVYCKKKVPEQTEEPLQPVTIGEGGTLMREPKFLTMRLDQKEDGQPETENYK